MPTALCTDEHGDEIDRPHRSGPGNGSPQDASTCPGVRADGGTVIELPAAEPIVGHEAMSQTHCTHGELLDA
jgi:hypothetical protein